MLPIALGSLLATFILLAIAYYRSSTKYAVEKRIDHIETIDATTQEEELQKPFAQRILLPMGDAAAKLFRGYAPGEVGDKVQKRLIMAGLFPHVSPLQFQGLCWIGMIVCLGIILMTLVSMSGAGGSIRWDDPFNLVMLITGVVAGYYVPQFILSKIIAKRQEEILRALPYAIDLLSITVEAGMGFDAAVGYVMKKSKGPLTEEFAKTLNEIRLGKARLDALEDLGNRTGVEDLKTFISAVVHASRLGGGITNTLRIQADSMRVRRRQRAQEEAMKAPIKIMFPLIFFIFPALFIVILGPAVISIWFNLLS